jgi:hypothetical protein
MPNDHYPVNHIDTPEMYDMPDQSTVAGRPREQLQSVTSVMEDSLSGRSALPAITFRNTHLRTWMTPVINQLID